MRCGSRRSHRRSSSRPWSLALRGVPILIDPAERHVVGPTRLQTRIVEQPTADGGPFADIFTQSESHKLLSQGFGVFPEIHDVDDHIHILRVPRAATARCCDEELGDRAPEKHKPVTERREAFHDPHQHRDVIGDTLSH
jgi:hypothetical protein